MAFLYINEIIYLTNLILYLELNTYINYKARQNKKTTYGNYLTALQKDGIFILTSGTL